jgi:hypothetical protein
MTMNSNSEPSHEAAEAAIVLTESEGSEEAAPNSKNVLPEAESAALEDEDVLVHTPDIARPWMAWLLVLVLALLFLFVLPPLSQSGLWDPFELNVADLARRVAINLHGATQLSLEDADNSLPHLNDLGRPQAAFTAMALGFKYFGLHDWSGRVPLALIGLLGVLATYGFMSRLVDRRAGVFSAAVLISSPLYFVQARTMLGDVVPMAALAMSFGGLLVASSDTRAPTVQRLLWLAIGVLGLALGFASRGALVGVVIPALSVGVAGMITGKIPSFASRGTFRVLVAIVQGKFAFGFVVCSVSLALGLRCAWLAVSAFDTLDARSDLSPWIGAMIRMPGKYPTFDVVIAHVAHSMAPWSALVPFAVGRMFRAPKADSIEAADSESSLRVALLLAASIALLVHGFLAARTDALTFSAPVILACIVGVAMRDYEKGAPPSLVGGIVTTIFLALLHHDFHGTPEKAYQAFGVGTTSAFPESFKDKSYLLWTIALIGFAAIVIFSLAERDPKREPFDGRNYVKVLDGLRTAWEGSLAVGYFASVAAASIAALAVWGGLRFNVKVVVNLATNQKVLAMNAWWVVALGPFLVIFGAYFAADLWAWLFEQSKPLSSASLARSASPQQKLLLAAQTANKNIEGETLGFAEDTARIFSAAFLIALALAPLVAAILLWRAHQPWPIIVVGAVFVSGFTLVPRVLADFCRTRGAFIVLSGCAFGALLNAAYFPALANQVSPKDVFDTYRKSMHDGEPLALFGVGGKTSSYYAGSQTIVHADSDSAFRWLTSGGNSRRFLAAKAEELPRLNQMSRKLLHRNIAVIDGRSSQIMLLASKGVDGMVDQNPLNRIVMSEAPKIQRPLDVNLDDKLQVLGLDITDSEGKLTQTVSTLKKYHIKTYYRVTASMQSEWEAFIHIDGFQRRHNGDHKPCASKYPMMLWQAGDVIVDDYEFSLEPNFTQGEYTIFFGFYLGESRLKVKSGTQDGENRINGGMLNVR